MGKIKTNEIIEIIDNRYHPNNLLRFLLEHNSNAFDLYYKIMMAKIIFDFFKDNGPKNNRQKCTNDEIIKIIYFIKCSGQYPNLYNPSLLTDEHISSVLHSISHQYELCRNGLDNVDDKVAKKIDQKIVDDDAALIEAFKYNGFANPTKCLIHFLHDYKQNELDDLIYKYLIDEFYGLDFHDKNYKKDTIKLNIDLYVKIRIARARLVQIIIDFFQFYLNVINTKEEIPDIFKEYSNKISEFQVKYNNIATLNDFRAFAAITILGINFKFIDLFGQKSKECFIAFLEKHMNKDEKIINFKTRLVQIIIDFLEIYFDAKGITFCIDLERSFLTVRKNTPEMKDFREATISKLQDKYAKISDYQIIKLMIIFGLNFNDLGDLVLALKTFDINLINEFLTKVNGDHHEGIDYDSEIHFFLLNSSFDTTEIIRSMINDAVSGYEVETLLENIYEYITIHRSRDNNSRTDENTVHVNIRREEMS